MRLPVLTAADGASWEASVVGGLGDGDSAVEVVRRCVDVIELLAVAASGQARAALVSASLRRLDVDAVERLSAAGTVPVGVVERGDVAAEERLRAMGVAFVVASDIDPGVLASVIEEAVREAGDGVASSSRAFAPEPAQAAASRIVDVADSSSVDAPAPSAPRSTVLVAVWGPAGAPGRSTVALTLADEIARCGSSSLLIDGDVYGGTLAPALGLLDESPGIAAACRQAVTSRLGADELAALSWQISPRFRVLTGIPRAERWPELRVSAADNVLAAARQLADVIVADVGFCLESDEELSYDTAAPRRNGLTLAILDAADLIIAVGSADPIGMQRLVRGLGELSDAGLTNTVWVVLNRVRAGIAPGNPETEFAAALSRFGGREPAALLPFDQEAIDASLAAGKTVGEARPNSAFRRSMVELAHAIVGAPEPRRKRRHRR